MGDIKKPNWDKPRTPGVGGFYDKTKGMPPHNYISKGMTANATIDKVRVDLKILKVREENVVEAEVLQICNESQTVEELHTGDVVHIERHFIGHLGQTNGE